MSRLETAASYIQAEIEYIVETMPNLPEPDKTIALELAMMRDRIMEIAGVEHDKKPVSSKLMEAD